ncbi:Outer membrane protein (OmpH-like) [Tenacibaculum sp. MAR_2009_124]|uniref:OmpH family outer membrane protein n=1 Tax=Tenacibaculum sp. MAR_2009_124 TaxID=1250059 RepID=UPI00089D2BD2|nr:OmpH family outer membrane protein [Tenacibaculum sp. MAR_2009_124]SED15140.1 Outer membrane protein (OmpH-like) [Tenacibaculum sp. MAR_2009_124]
MKKNILTIVLLLIVTVSFAQKSQRLAYIDMDYILQNIPEYIDAQNALNAKVEKWRNKLDKEARNIEVQKTDLANEKAILTKELIEEREEDIQVKQEALRRLESLYFGPRGDMFNLRKQLIQPVQDQVYNAIQDIAKRKKYDFVFDKSSELVMLYSNKKHDISDLIVKMIKIDQKQQAKKEKIEAKKELLSNKGDLSDKQKQREALKQKKIKEREERIKKIEEQRKSRLKAQADKRKLLKEKKEALRKAKEAEKKKKELEKKQQEEKNK